MTRIPPKEEKALVCELIAQLKCKEQWKMKDEYGWDCYPINKIENQITKVQMKFKFKEPTLYHPTKVEFSIWSRLKLKYYFKKVIKYLNDIEERKDQSLAIKELGHLISPPSQVVTEVEHTFINPIPDYKLGDFMKET